MSSYPQVSLPAYVDLREALRKSVPNEITTIWVQVNLPQYASEASAKTLISALRKLGLIDKESKPSKIAMKWRTDDGYREACVEMLATAFPHELVQAYGQKGAEKATVERAIMNGGMGESSSRAVAKLFCLLAEASLDGLNLKRVQPKSKQSPDNPRPKPIQKPRVNEEVPSRAEVSDRIVPEAARDQISLRFLLAQGRVAELLIPADITDKERKRLLRHLEIDLSEEISDL